MISDDEFLSSLDVSKLPPVIAAAFLRLVRNCSRDRDDWQVAVQTEDFTKVYNDRDFESLIQILVEDICMWLCARQRGPEVDPPVEFILLRNPPRRLTRARAIRAPRG